MIVHAGILLAMLASGAVATSANESRRPERPPLHASAVAADGTLTITLPPDLLRVNEVREQLTSGLTTVFVVTVSANDGKRSVKGGARIDVRYALWEEQYLVAVYDVTGQQKRFTFTSEGAFGRWWAENPLVVTPRHPYGRSVDVEVTLKMLPFSSQEQNDTRKWLSRTLSASQAEAGRLAAGDPADLLRVIVETSVRRRPLLERTWSVQARREPAK